MIFNNIQIPKDIIDNITVKFLKPKNLLTCCSVSHAFNNIISENSESNKFYWKYYITRHYDKSRNFNIHDKAIDLKKIYGERYKTEKVTFEYLNRTFLKIGKPFWDLPDNHKKLIFTAAEPFMNGENPKAIWLYLTGGSDFDKTAAVPKETFKHIEKAAAKGFIDAASWLGGYYCIKNQKDKGISWLRINAEKNHVKSMEFLAKVFKGESGGYPPNPTEAFKMIEKITMVDKKNKQLLALGNFYAMGYGCEKDSYKAHDCKQQYYRLNSIDPFIHIRISLIKFPEFIGQCSFSYGVENNPDKVFKFYEYASSQGNLIAELHLGLCYMMGYGCEKNEVKAQKCIENASANEINAWLARLCLANIRGDGTFIALAQEAFDLANNNPNLIILRNFAGTILGRCFYEGKVIEKDHIKSFKYFETIALENLSYIASAQYAKIWLAICYENGFFVSQNNEIAKKFYDSVEKTNIDKEKKYIFSIIKDHLEVSEKSILGKRAAEPHEEEPPFKKPHIEQ